MRYFEMDKNYSYVIYGAAYKGKKALELLRNAGYKVNVFFDKRAESLKEVDGIPVVDPDKYNHNHVENTVVLVTINNLFEHPVIADYINSLGYDKVIFRPLYELYEDETVNVVDDFYNSLSKGILKDAIKFPVMEDSKFQFEDGCKISVEKGYVIALIPIDLCFSKQNKHFKQQVIDSSAPRVLPTFMSRYELVNYFRAISGALSNVRQSVDAYLDYMKINADVNNVPYPIETEQGLVDLMTNRYNAFFGMLKNHQKGIDYFVKNPIDVEWNENYFLVCDGEHRVCYFTAMGFPYIPARILKEDYEKWINAEVLKDCINYVKCNHIYASYLPILHPNFYYFMNYRTLGGVTRLQQICMFLEYNNFDFYGRKVVDIGSYFGYLSQFFSRMGAEVTSVEYNPISCEFGNKLNKLLYCGKIKSICAGAESIEVKEKYSVAIMLTVLYWHLDTVTGLKIIENIDLITDDFLIWESGNEPERERQFIFEHTHFSNYIKIAETIGTGKVREMGIFCKPHMKFNVPYWL